MKLLFLFIWIPAAWAGTTKTLTFESNTVIYDTESHQATLQPSGSRPEHKFGPLLGAHYHPFEIRGSKLFWIPRESDSMESKHLYVKDLVSGAMKMISHTFEDFRSSPDGKQIVFLSQKDGRYHIHLSVADTGQVDLAYSTPENQEQVITLVKWDDQSKDFYFGTADTAGSWEILHALSKGKAVKVGRGFPPDIQLDPALYVFKPAAGSDKVSPRTLPEGYPLHIETNAWDLIDVQFKNNKAAFRHTYQLRPQHESIETADGEETKKHPPVSCSYPGMKRTPLSGVILGILDLKTLQIESFDFVYRSVVKKSDCTSEDASKSALASMKEKIKKLGMNPDRKLKTTSLKPRYPGMSVDPHAHIFNIGTSKLLFLSHSMGDSDALLDFSTSKDLGQTAASTLIEIKTKKIIFQRLQQEELAMGSRTTHSTHTLYQEAGSVLMIEKSLHWDRTADKIIEWFRPLPVLKEPL